MLTESRKGDIMIHHGKGTVMDPRTGLIWEQHPSDMKYTWKQATDKRIVEINTMQLGGHTDWRLPELQELVSIVDYMRFNPACDPILMCQSSRYWSATTYQVLPSGAWLVNFFDGIVYATSKPINFYVRGVRGGSVNPLV